jgi:hypothetical protein
MRYPELCDTFAIQQQSHTIDGAGSLDSLDVETGAVKGVKIDELISEAIMCDDYEKIKELKVSVYVAITSITKSIDT